MECPEVSAEFIYQRLKRNYLTIFLLASFVDWLQGPYLYTIYSSLNYTKTDICFFYIIGFASSGLFGIFIGHIADKCGRKKICIIYFLSTIITCLCTTSKTREILIIGRVFGGVSTSILCSTFESWYICQHLLRYHLEKDLISTTFSKSTFYNGLTAIFSGFISSLLVDTLNYGPTIPFLISIPISIISATFCTVLWTENVKIIPKSKPPSIFKALRIIFSRDHRPLIILGIVQIIFETVMYTFVFLWAPVLDPIDPSYGFIFGVFMICMGIGSFLHSFFVNYFKVRIENLLCMSVILGLSSIVICTVGVHMQEEKEQLYFATYLCLIGFLSFEMAIGMYFPAISYLRAVVAPESFRASIVNWLRLPCNLLIIVVLLCMRIGGTDNRLVFALSSIQLSIAALYSLEFVKVYSHKYEGNKQSGSTLTL